MPRPMKGRRVCKMPSVNKFGPLNVPKNPDEAIIMTVDEYETIRLIDLEGYKQQFRDLGYSISDAADAEELLTAVSNVETEAL